MRFPRFRLVTGCLVAMLCAWASGDELRSPRARNGSSGDVATLDSSTASAEQIEISSQYAQHWTSPEGTTVYLLRGRCIVQQGRRQLSADQMVVWGERISDDGGAGELVVYLEGQALLQEPGRRVQEPTLLLELSTSAGFVLTAQSKALSGDQNPVYRRAVERRRSLGGSGATALLASQSGPVLPMLPGPQAPSLLPRRHVTINSRYLNQDLVINAEPYSGTTPAEYVITITKGVNVVVDNVPLNVDGQLMLTRVDLTADRAVIWTDQNIVDTGASFDLDDNTPLQVYLEGNIIARQGMNEARASHAFYDLTSRRGLLMNAELRTFIPELDGPLRIRADSIRQLSENNFHARNAFVTTSTFGRPGYRVEASDIFVEERYDPRSTRIDPRTGVVDATEPWITSHNSRFYIEEVPLLALPYISGPAREIQVPIERLDVGYSGIFGLQVESVFNVETLFGLDLPSGVDVGLQADLFTMRGPGVGLRSDYDAWGGFLGMPVRHSGLSRLYYIHDSGKDNLGLGRRNLEPSTENRGRALLRHRMDFSERTWVNAELGYLSDRNFLEQYDETGWDRDKDYESLVALNHLNGNVSVNGLVRGRLNDFSDQTDWLPRADISVLGEPLLGTLATWTSRSSVGYGRIRTADAPSDPDDVFQPLDFLQESSGLVAMTRHQLDVPFMLGPINVVPYVLGEAAAWQEDYDGSQLTRLYGSAGVRASIQFFKAFPNLYDPVLGLNGLAHKMKFDVDYYIAEATESLAGVPQYNEFDDDAQERFRERFVPLEFGGVLPPQFDPRYYAVRSGAGRGVTDPYFELVDDQHVVRLGWRNRLQTKVGRPDRPRIRDWMTLDLEASLFPNADRDNFGETFGLMNGRYAWHVGERTSIIANGVFDIFDGGQRVWNVGLLSQRSARGSVYVGFRQVEIGPIDSQLITGSYSYRMSDKWVSTLGAAYDIAEGRDRGESITITRIGESMLLHMGLGFDVSRNNLGFGISVEPRIGPFDSASGQLSSLLGISR
ncbi:MAG: LPS-assembly protein LptD [Planctomyces sp.]|nr:LPS-assembly protein LptD [Planctomyces sp.]